jgi:hypothetical protein
MAQVASNKAARLPYPHYSNEQFAFGKGESLIFDDGTGLGDFTNYSDRYCSWDREAYNRASSATKERTDKYVSAQYWEDWLASYYEKPVTIHKIWACTDAGGYPIWAFKYTVGE